MNYSLGLVEFLVGTTGFHFALNSSFG